MFNVTPSTVKYTPVSKTVGVPKLPTIGNLCSYQIPVISGFPIIIEKTVLLAAKNNPKAKTLIGCIVKIDFTLSMPKPSKYKENAAEATSPPTKPPPGWLCPRNSKKTEKISKSGSKYIVIVLNIIDLISLLLAFLNVKENTHQLLQLQVQLFRPLYRSHGSPLK